MNNYHVIQDKQEMHIIIVTKLKGRTLPPKLKDRGLNNSHVALFPLRYAYDTLLPLSGGKLEAYRFQGCF